MMTVHKMNMNMYKTCYCQYNWIHMKSFGERPNFNIYPLIGDRLGGGIHVQQLF